MKSSQDVSETVPRSNFPSQILLEITVNDDIKQSLTCKSAPFVPRLASVERYHLDLFQIALLVNGCICFQGKRISVDAAWNINTGS